MEEHYKSLSVIHAAMRTQLDVEVTQCCKQ